MTNYESQEVEIKKSAEAFFNQFSNLNHLRDILPPQASEFTSTENSCSFKIGGMPSIHLEIAEKLPFSKIVLTAKNSPSPFLLICEIKENNEHCKVKLMISAELNMMMRMMLEKPLTNFLQQSANAMAAI